MPADEGWDWDGDDWDPAQSLTAEEIAELSGRRRAQVAAGADPHLAEHVSDEVAMALTLTSWAAGTLVDRAEGLARLPKTMAALAAGEIDVAKALVLLGELSGLGDVHAARVEAAVISRAAAHRCAKAGPGRPPPGPGTPLETQDSHRPNPAAQPEVQDSPI